HINDLHSHLEKWPRIVTYLQEKRNEYNKTEDSFFAFDLGDAVDRVHPLIEATSGQAMTRFLNEAKIDAATIGNNEGLGGSKEQLDQLYQAANFPIVLSNLKDKKTGNYPEWAVPFRVLRTKKGQ